MSSPIRVELTENTPELELVTTSTEVRVTPPQPIKLELTTNNSGVSGNVSQPIQLELSTNTQTLQLTPQPSTELELQGFSGPFVSDLADRVADLEADPVGLPDQLGHGGEFLSTNGTDLSWAAVPNPDLSGLVPYTGALFDVALGAHSITASNLSGTNTGDQDLSGYLTSATAATTYLKLNQTTPQTTVGTFTFPNIKDSALTSTRIPYASTGGLLIDSANLTYDGTSLNVSSSGKLKLGDVYFSRTSNDLISVVPTTDPNAQFSFGSIYGDQSAIFAPTTSGSPRQFAIFNGSGDGANIYFGVFGGPGSYGEVLNIFKDHSYFNGLLGINVVNPSAELDINFGATANIQFSDSTENHPDYGADSPTEQIISTGRKLILGETGDYYGATYLEIGARSGLTGALFKQTGIDVVDFAFQSSSGASGQKNLRVENRFSRMAVNADGEFVLLLDPNQVGLGFKEVFNIGRSGATFWGEDKAEGRLGGFLGINTVSPTVPLEVYTNTLSGSSEEYPNSTNFTTTHGDINISSVSGNYIDTHNANGATDYPNSSYFQLAHPPSGTTISGWINGYSDTIYDNGDGNIYRSFDNTSIGSVDYGTGVVDTQGNPDTVDEITYEYYGTESSFYDAGDGVLYSSIDNSPIANINYTTGEVETTSYYAETISYISYSYGTPGLTTVAKFNGNIDVTGSMTSSGDFINTDTVDGRFNFNSAPGAPLAGFTAVDSTNSYGIVFSANASNGYLDWAGTLHLRNGMGSTELMTILTGGNVGIAVTSPNSKLQVNGSFALPYVAKTANYTLTTSDHTVNCTSNSFTLTLPTAASIAGRIYNLKNSGTGTITVNTTSSQTIDGMASGTITLAQYEGITVQSNGSNWIIL